MQLTGEEKGFAFLKGLNRSVNQRTRSGAAPAKATALGGTAVGITSMHDMITTVVDGAPVRVVAPREGTGHGIGPMSIVKGARDLGNAERWHDRSLTPAAQGSGAQTEQHRAPSPKAAPGLATHALRSLRRSLPRPGRGRPCVR